MKFKRSIGKIALLSASLGGMIGSGWLFGPLYTAKLAGPASIFSWIIAGILTFIIAINFVELGTLFPVPGGITRFSESTHDDCVNFTICWMMWLSNVVLAPIETIAVIQYASNYYPWLVMIKHHATLLSVYGMLIAAVLLLMMCLLNAIGAKFFAKSNTIVVGLKFLVPILTILALAFTDFKLKNFTAYHGFLPMGWHGVLTALPAAGVVFSFVGFSAAIQMSGEAKNPKKDVRFAVIGAILVCLVLYVLLQAVFIAAVFPHDLTQGWQHLSYKGVNGPFAGLASILGITWLIFLIYGDAVISPLGTGYVYTASVSRITYALSKHGYFPGFLQKLSGKTHVPVFAMFFNYIVGLLLLLPFPGWQKLVPFFVSCVVFAYIIGPIAVVVYRQHKPELARTFSVPKPKFVSALGFYACSLIVYWTGWHTLSKVLIAVAIGYVVLLLLRLFGEAGRIHLSIKRCAWLLVYLLGMGAISYAGTFGGGKGWLAFGDDFLVIAIFSVLIFFWAVAAARSDVPTII